MDQDDRRLAALVYRRTRHFEDAERRREAGAKEPSRSTDRNTILTSVRRKHMQVLHLSVTDTKVGTARAAHRLHTGLRQLDQFILADDDGPLVDDGRRSDRSIELARDD